MNTEEQHQEQGKLGNGDRGMKRRKYNHHFDRPSQNKQDFQIKEPVEDNKACL